VDATLQIKPAGMTHRSCRTMAQSQGVSKSTVNNIWRAYNLQPHRSETFKLSGDPKFLEKMTDAVGLYWNPAQQVIVLCVDEKSQIQTLDRAQPLLHALRPIPGPVDRRFKVAAPNLYSRAALRSVMGGSGSFHGLYPLMDYQVRAQYEGN
jgi:hypothetical protein